MKQSKQSTAAKTTKSMARALLQHGGVGVLPTDTLYGIVGSALSPKTVHRVYRLRHRNPKKPLIILISSVNDLKIFNIAIDTNMKKVLKKIWPGKVSVILKISSKEKTSAKIISKWKYLHRGMGALAFRLPKPSWLRSLLKHTGPLVAPSANLEGEPPAWTIAEAKKYFGNNIDFYLDAGRLSSKPSTLAKLENGKLTVVRKGAALLNRSQI